MFNRIKKSAFSLVEVLVAVGVFAIFSAVFLVALSGVSFNVSNSEDRLAARYLTQEAEEALRSMRDHQWDQLQEGTFGLDYATNDYWELSGSSDTYDKFTRTVELTALALFRYEAEITITWTTDEGIAQSQVSTLRLTNWEALYFAMDSFAEFEEGFFNSVKTLVAGSVDLSTTYTGWDAFTELIAQGTDGTGDPNEIVLDNNLLYMVTDSTAGEELTVFNVDDVTSGVITELDSLEIGANVNDMVIHEGYGYLATSGDSAEMVVVDLADISLVQSVDLAGAADGLGIDVVDDVAVVTRAFQNPNPEVSFLDVSTPEGSITELGSNDHGSTLYDVEIHDGYAITVSDDNSGEIAVFGLSDYLLANTVNLNGNADATAIFLDETAELAYVGRADSVDPEFLEIDVASPAGFDTGDITGSEDVNGTVNDIYVDEDKAYLASDGSSDELEIVELTGYTVDDTIDISASSNGNAVWFQGVHVFLGNENDSSELLVLESDETAWAIATLLDSDNTGGTTDMMSLDIEGNYAYMGRATSGSCNTGTGENCELVIYDISTPSAVTFVSGLEVGGAVNDLVVSGDYAYLATTVNSQELVLVDISNPSAPSIVGSYNASGNQDARGVTVSGTYAYLVRASVTGTCTVATGAGCEFFIINVVVPALPVFVQGLETGGNLNDVEVAGNYAFVSAEADSAELGVVDISNPLSLSTAATYNHPGTGDARRMFYDSTDSTLHVSFLSNGSDGEYSILDVSTPTSPTRTGFLDLGGSANDVVVVTGDDRAFLATTIALNQFVAVDISTQSAPVALGTLNLAADANGIDSNGTQMFVASASNTQELQVVGTSSSSTELGRFGIYTSKKFDSGSASTDWLELNWTSSGTGTIQVQTRTASSAAGLDLAEWVGSDGTGDTYYTTFPIDIAVSPSASGTQYMQVAVYLSGDSVTTPVLESISLSYNK